IGSRISPHTTSSYKPVMTLGAGLNGHHLYSKISSSTFEMAGACLFIILPITPSPIGRHTIRLLELVGGARRKAWPWLFLTLAKYCESLGARAKAPGMAVV